MTEKIGGVEGTKLDVDFVDMERVIVCMYYFQTLLVFSFASNTPRRVENLI